MTRFAAVVDLGGTRVRTAVADRSLRLLGRIEEPTQLQRGPSGVVDQIVELIHRSAHDADISPLSLEQAVAGSPGPLDPASGVVISPPNLPGWHDVPLRDLLGSALRLPVRIANDANVAAVGEFHCGAGRGQRNLVYLTISTGIGGGIVVDGRLLEGSSGAAGELGHMTIDRRGPVCNCGNIGCLEAIASGTAIARAYNNRVVGSSGAGYATAKDVAEAVSKGDVVAQQIFNDAAEAIGHGVVTCINLFNPDVVVLGGGVALAGDLLFEPVRRIVNLYALEVSRKAARIVPAELGVDAGLVGAAALAHGV